MKNIFEKSTVAEVIQRINNLTPSTDNVWGKMDVAQMLAHCNVTYDMAFTDKYAKPNFIKKFLLKAFVKHMVVGSKPYPRNGRTAPIFLITSKRNFEKEKTKIIYYIEKTRDLGEAHFHNKESHSFGKLTKEEWNIMFYKHLDHHLTQFGV